MTSSRFFRAIWRVNGVLILLAFLLGAIGAAVGVLASVSWGDDRGVHLPPSAVADGERLELGAVEAVDGTPHVLLPLETHGSAGGLKNLSSGHTSATRNVLFYDTEAGAPRWLRPDHHAVILEREFIRARVEPGHEADGRVRFIRYEIADADSDGDGEVTASDASHVAVSGPGGEGLATVLAGADELLGYRDTGGETLLVFHRRGGEHLVAEIDLAARRTRRTVKLPVR
jgi:hypothetical protein